MVDFLHYSAAETEAPSPGILVSAHFDQPDGYRVYRPRGTRDWLLTFTLSGQGIYRQGRRQQVCAEGDIAILAPGAPHDYATFPGERWQFLWVHFVPVPEWIPYLHPLPQVWNGLLYCHIDDSYTKRRITMAMERLVDDSRDRNTHSPFLTLNALEEIMLLLTQKFGGGNRQALDYRVEEVLRILSRQMQEQHSVAHLADHVNLSPSRLAHLFKAETGDSIIETLIKIRLRQAARLLEFTSRQIGEISEDVGFRDPFYFTRQFTAYFGMSPSAFRKQRSSPPTS